MAEYMINIEIHPESRAHTNTAVHPAAILFIPNRRLRPSRKQQEALYDLHTLVAASECAHTKLMRCRHYLRVQFRLLGVVFGSYGADAGKEEGRARSD